MDSRCVQQRDIDLWSVESGAAAEHLDRSVPSKEDLADSAPYKDDWVPCDDVCAG